MPGVPTRGYCKTVLATNATNSVGLIGDQIEEPVEALDKDKSGERVVMYIFVIVCEMSSN